MNGLVFDQVVVRFGSGHRVVKAVDTVSLTVPPGQVVGLVGESGSGKSTLGRASVGLVPIHSGTVLVDGRPLTGRRGRGEPRPVQMIYQDPYSSLDPRMTVGASIAEAIPSSVARTRGEKAAEVARLLELVNLDPDRAAMLPGGLSGGQRQRIALARALGARPRYVVADEITSALDVSVQGAVLNMVSGLQREFNLGMLFISHNLAAVRYVSDFIAVMYLGQVVEFGEAAQVIGSPQHPYTRELLAAAPHRQAPGAQLSPAAAPISLEAELPDPHDPPPGCRFHTRCPIGPMGVSEHGVSDRTLCTTDDPQAGASGRENHASCHFASALTVR